MIGGVQLRDFGVACGLADSGAGAATHDLPVVGILGSTRAEGYNVDHGPPFMQGLKERCSVGSRYKT